MGKPRMTWPVMKGLVQLKRIAENYGLQDDLGLKRAFEFIEQMEPHVKQSNPPPDFKLTP